jgi:hypothetical protein
MAIDLGIDTFEGAVEYLTSMIGDDFEKALQTANSIIADPSQYTGPLAAITAIKLANQRYKIGMAAQYWKNKSVGSANRQDKLIKDALMTAYDALVEVINTLKLVARHEHELVK